MSSLMAVMPRGSSMPTLPSREYSTGIVCRMLWFAGTATSAWAASMTLFDVQLHDRAGRPAKGYHPFSPYACYFSAAKSHSHFGDILTDHILRIAYCLPHRSYGLVKVYYESLPDTI